MFLGIYGLHETICGLVIQTQTNGETLFKCVGYKLVLGPGPSVRGYTNQNVWLDKGVCATVVGFCGRYSWNVEMFLGTRDRI